MWIEDDLERSTEEIAYSKLSTAIVLAKSIKVIEQVYPSTISIKEIERVIEIK